MGENLDIDPDIYDPDFVKQVFDRCSGKYIAFSYVCSFGFTEIWRKQAIEKMPEPNSDKHIVYDIMAGTGEVWPHILKRFPKTKSIKAIDISSGMHERAMRRLHRHRKNKIEFIRDDVLSTELDRNSCDIVISTFGLKTFSSSQHEKLADLVEHVLKPGGVFSFIEASDPKGWFVRPIYIFHLTKILPLVERFFMKGAQDFAMIGTYSSNFGNAKSFAQMLSDRGLHVEYKKFFYGCATGVVGRKVN